MQVAATDFRIELIDVPSFWKSPSYVKSNVGLSGQVDHEIYYSVFYGQSPPTKILPYATRGCIKITENKLSYFVGILHILTTPATAYTYPPNSTNMIDPIGLYSGKIIRVVPLLKEQFDLPFSEYKELIPQTITEALAQYNL